MGYAGVMPFSADDLGVLDSADEVEIETRSTQGNVHRTIIWIVVDGTDVFIRSYRGAGARWYREALARPDVAILAGERRLEGTVRPAADDVSIRRTSDGFRRKYTRDPATPAMLRDEVLDTTLRIDPA